MSDEAVAFHFSESESASSSAAFCWLACEHLHLSASSGVHLVGDHVMQFLVVDDAHEDVGHKLPAIDAVVENLASAVLET